MMSLFAEEFGFSDTAFRVFILMVSRRLKSDCFLTKDYRAKIYTELGLKWIDKDLFTSVLQRHYAELTPALNGVQNGFRPWQRLSS
jgi:hypothetical protein